MHFAYVPTPKLKNHSTYKPLMIYSITVLVPLGDRLQRTSVRPHAGPKMMRLKRLLVHRKVTIFLMIIYNFREVGVPYATKCDQSPRQLPVSHFPPVALSIETVVPRTFAGAFILSSIARTVSWVVPKQIFDLPSHPMIVQFLIRLELLLFSWSAHLRLSVALERYAGVGQVIESSARLTTSATIAPMVSNYFLLVTASQFHIPFYSSRLLPNTFALILTCHAYAEWLNGKPRRTAAYLVFTTAVFRCDVLLLLFTVGLTILIQRQLSIVQAIITGVLTGVFSLLSTVPLDSLLWGRPVWPEFEVWWFNAVDNRSSEWGTMPFLWYFTTALPKGMLLTALLVPLAFVRLPESIITWTRMYCDESKKTTQSRGWQSRRMFDLCLVPLFAPVFCFVLLYSFLPHKEMRFVFPALPMFNVCAAYGISRLHCLAFPDSNAMRSERKSNDWKHTRLIARGMHLCGMVAVAFTLLGSIVFVRLSKENYPGGVALERLRSHLETTIQLQSSSTTKLPQSAPSDDKKDSRTWESVHVHIDVEAAMTGVSLFGQRYASRRLFNGKKNPTEGTFVIKKSGYEDSHRSKGSSLKFTHILTDHHLPGYHVIHAIPGHPRLDLRNFRIDTENAIYILEKDGW
jgi:alpha-1,6-mannosyltransferase